MTSNENNAPDINLDEFLPMPGASDIVTASENTKPTTVFSKPEPFTTNFLDKKEEEKKEEGGEEKKEEKVDLEAATQMIDEITGDEPAESKGPGRPKLDKSGLVDTFSKLIDEGLLVPFDDDKPMEDYSVKDWKELLQANFEDREHKARQEQTGEIIQQLPDELKLAYKYISDGGTDLKGLFRVLSHVEEVRSLNPEDERDQEAIVRNYYRSKGDLTEQEINDEIDTFKDLGTLEKKAKQYKPKLDAVEAKKVEERLRQQEEFQRYKHEAAQQYMDNVYDTLKNGQLNGIKLDKKTQAFLFAELTQPKYQTADGSGRTTNLLGHLLERYQFTEPRYDLVAEALWLLADPDGYKNQIRTMAKNEATQDTVRKLKTEESRKISTSMAEEQEDQPAKRKLPRQQNIFKR
jgi:hypothetical protein